MRGEARCGKGFVESRSSNSQDWLCSNKGKAHRFPATSQEHKMAGGRSTTGRTRAYGEGTPWIFTGRALYQLHLVKAEVAQPFIPAGLKLVQAFGYTLGGLYLARYNGSPAGVFDELVVIAGIVWNPPTSCAWAATVLVNNEEACDHGKKDVGLPSQLAKFAQTSSVTTKKQSAWRSLASRFQSIGSSHQSSQEQLRSSKEEFYETGFDIGIEEGNEIYPLCHIALPPNTVIQNELPRRYSPPYIKMSLPSFSGKTDLRPQLLKYSCGLRSRISIVRPAVVASASDLSRVSESAQKPPMRKQVDKNAAVQAILTSKPIFAIHFDDMHMEVEAPTLVSPNQAASSAEEVVSTGVLQPAFADRK